MDQKLHHGIPADIIEPDLQTQIHCDDDVEAMS